MEDRWLFKAKQISNGDWVKGHLITDEINDSTCFIGCVFGTDEDGEPHDFDVVQVDPDTICQCTGLKDKNWELIWENDIVEIIGEDERFKIIWSDTEGEWEMEDEIGRFVVGFNNNWSGEVEVVGNIFDNPELLGGAE